MIQSKSEMFLKKYLPLCFSIFLILVISSPAFGEWHLYKRTDLKNKEGDSLRVESWGDNKIKIWFIPQKKIRKTVSGKMLVYRVDDHAVRRLDHVSGLSMKKGRIKWFISKGKMPSEELIEFMNGEEVVFQFYLDDGQIMEAVFLLEGVTEAVSEVMEPWK